MLAKKDWAMSRTIRTPNFIRKSFFKQSLITSERKRFRVTISILGAKTLQTLPIWGPLHTPIGSPSTTQRTKMNRGNKFYQSRLTKWVDRLFSFHFSVEFTLGSNMGFAVYLSRNPSGELLPPSNKDQNFVFNTIEGFKHPSLRNNLALYRAIKESERNLYRQCIDLTNTKHTYTKKNKLFLQQTAFISTTLLIRILNFSNKAFHLSLICCNFHTGKSFKGHFQKPLKKTV